MCPNLEVFFLIGEGPSSEGTHVATHLHGPRATFGGLRQQSPLCSPVQSQNPKVHGRRSGRHLAIATPRARVSWPARLRVLPSVRLTASLCHKSRLKNVLAGAADGLAVAARLVRISAGAADGSLPPLRLGPEPYQECPPPRRLCHGPTGSGWSALRSRAAIGQF